MVNSLFGKNTDHISAFDCLNTLIMYPEKTPNVSRDVIPADIGVRESSLNQYFPAAETGDFSEASAKVSPGIPAETGSPETRSSLRSLN